MWDTLSDEHLCYPGYNTSCRKAEFGVGAQAGLYLLFGGFIVVNILGNSVVILSIAHFKQLHSPTNVVVMSLALVDLLVGVIVVPFSMTRTVQGCWFYGDNLCLLHCGTDIFLTGASILHIVCIAVDRYEAVCNPMRYTNNTTMYMSVAWIMSVACWVIGAAHSYGVILSKANFIGQEDYLESIYCKGRCNLFYNTLWGTTYTTLFFFLPILVIVCLYSRIFLVAKEHARKIEDSNHCPQAKGGQLKRSEHKAAKTLGIVVGVFIFCWMPYCLNSIIDPFIGYNTSITLFEVFNWLTYFNSTMNPIIYAMFYPWFRKCLKLIVNLKIFNRNSSDINLFSP